MTAGRLTGKVCVIAGAAGVIGEAAAAKFESEGAIVVGIDLNEHAVGVLSLQADLAVEPDVESVFARIHHEFGRIDVLLNNAGLNDPHDHSVLHMEQETWDRVFAANLTTTFLTCKHGIPYMLANDPPSGSVINTASFLSEMGAATSQMAYSAATAAVIQLSRDLGTNLARQGVRVNALCLGPIETPQLQEMFGSLPPEELPKRLIHYPMGRFGTLEEYAGTVAYLASDDSGFVTGSSFPLNGGITTAFTVPS
ncbi:MAG TPA: SDR family oxidoreductase [Acidimicrobiales bacterium]|jgi:NAD(P)-dependent dehydrogenase (short-subunit alcohol dehydrogenase family)|nr:SDR family oxidoreductase [Acidimicrobiales bacterium]